MSLDFTIPELHIGNAGTPPIQFYKQGLKIGGSGTTPTYQDIVLSGNGSLSLTNAKANGLNYVKLFGGCSQASTPTPSSPVNIVCNNGAIKYRHQSGLPFGFTLLEYIEADGNQQLNTGVKIASTDVVYSEFANSSSSGYGALYGIYAMGESSAFYANSTYYGYDETNQKVNTNVSVDTNWHTVTHDFVNGTLTLDDTTATFTPFTFENSADNYLFSRYYNGSYGYGFKGKCRKHIITRGLTTRCNLLPVMRDSDSELGMYDIQNDVFCPNIGSGDFVGGNPVTDPLIICIDGTKETVRDSLNNTATVENLLAVNSHKDIQEVLTGEVTRNVAIKVFDGTETWSKISNQNAYYMSMDEMLYCNPVELGLSNQFVGAGVGTADMPDNSIKLTYTTNPNRGAILFKHNDTTTIEDWVQFVKDKYETGNPIIAIFPLATATTESVTGQSLTTKSGSNTITITQASINNLPLEVSYKGTV